MARILATHAPFLQSRATLLVVPMSSDGVVRHDVIRRHTGLYPSNYNEYQGLARAGELQLGDVLLHTVQKQATGLSVGTNKTADYIANLITTHHAHHNTQKSTLISTLKALRPKLFDLMRYQNLKAVAFYATPIINETIVPEFLWQSVHELLDLSRLTIEIHFAKEVDLITLGHKKVN